MVPVKPVRPGVQPLTVPDRVPVVNVLVAGRPPGGRIDAREERLGRCCVVAHAGEPPCGGHLRFTPFFDRVSLTDLRLVRSSTHQCFGTWDGWVADAGGNRWQVDGIEGSAEDVEQRW